MATREATWRYRDRFGDDFARTFYRSFEGSVVASVGLGTYLGEPDDATDEGYREAAVTALESGVNVLDTAINYRHQRSERALGRALDRAAVPREAALVATKGGFVPFDGERPADPAAAIREEYVQSGVLDAETLARGQHSLDPGFLADQLDRSLANLDLETVDLYYVHNPETQLTARSRPAVYDQLEAAFAMLERRVAAGDLAHYGVATWEAFRVPPDHESYLSLTEIVDRADAAAVAAGNDSSHLAAIQLPFNVEMADAFTVEAHGPDRDRAALTVAADAGLAAFASASLMQGKLVEGLPDPVAQRLAGETSAQRAINFTRSAPGVTAALVGTSSLDHLRENVAAGTFEPLGARAFDAVFE